VPAVHHVAAEGPPLSGGADALGLIYDEAAAAADWIAVPTGGSTPRSSR
jgi:hypothetical protein